MAKFMQWLSVEKQLHFANYETLWTWSTDETALFWAYVSQYFDVHFYTSPTQILNDAPMPHTKWFDGATLNYAERVFQGRNNLKPALQFYDETQILRSYSWQELERQVALVADFLRKQGVEEGNRVVAYLPNVPEAVIAFLAAASLGAIWSSCSPDFGVQSVVERFQQIEPKVLFATTSYQYNGKYFDRTPAVVEIAAALPTLNTVVLVNGSLSVNELPVVGWQEIMDTDSQSALTFRAVAFQHPLYVLYSSGTTGVPKVIVHGHGGICLEHLKYLSFHNDLRAGETFFWYSTTGWMMWNFSVSALMLGATLLLYDGSPSYPDAGILWQLAQRLPIHHFGTSAPYLMACQKNGLHFAPNALPNLRSINSTGSPLPPEVFDYVYEHIKPDVCLASMSGGTDICTAWVGANPLLPVYRGRIQARCLGCAMQSWDEMGNAVVDEVGEMVVVKPMPSMPVAFWNDPQQQKYLASYFEMYPHVWRHGDWLKIYANGSLEILGRSDATLNRHGIRIGTAEIYRVIDGIEGIKDSLIVNLELSGGKHFMPLFVVLQAGVELDNDLKNSVNLSLKTAYSPRYIPDQIIQAPDIPHTISGKKLEAPVKKILMGMDTQKAANLGSMRNPAALDFFVDWRKNHTELLCQG